MKKMVIFCVDDEKIVLNGLKTDLKEMFGSNYIIETAESGNEALDAIDALLSSNFEIPIIIADYAMPKMKGDELLTKIHERSPRTLKILLTGQATVEGITNAINNAGLYRYIAKPWDANDLTLTVKQALISYQQEDQLKIQNKKLIELSSSLEKKVEIRTLELQNTNDLLLKKQKEITLQNKELEEYRNHLEILVEVRTRELTIAKEKAEESDHLKSAFLANMSHEIRTPMSGILGFAELLREPMLEGEVLKSYVDVIEKSGERMLNILNDIIDISKIEAGLVTLTESETNINKLIDYVFSFFRPETEKKGLQLICKKAISTQEAIILSDSEKICAILINLVKNSIKFTHKGSIEVGYKLKTINNSDQLEFYVIDTGIGIPKNRQNAIFERFVQADIEDKKAIQGAGLGLSIAVAYVEMLKGKMWVESEEGQGSAFYFTLPYIPFNQIKNQEGTVTVESNDYILDKNLKILIAEDDLSVQQYFSIILEPYSKETFIAVNGTDAVEICRNNPDIDLVLMDIKMPKMSGSEATRQIREFNKNVIIIAQTAHALAGDRENTIDAGCDDYIAKPISRKVLIPMILKHFSKKKKSGINILV